MTPHGDVEEEVVAADSWFIRDGTALALDRHRERFLRAVPERRRAEAEAFWHASVAELPREGEWFPRVDLVAGEAGAEFRLRIRPAPPRMRSVRLVVHRGPDPRMLPRVKGPDLARMLRVRARAERAGADEAVILSREGHVVEGAYSALAWWRADVLCMPVPELDRIDSVTARVVREVAASRGLPVHSERVAVEGLGGTEVWVLSALHGLRVVTEWIGGPPLVEVPGRVDRWREDLAALRRPLS